MNNLPKFANPLEEELASCMLRVTPPKTRRKAGDPRYRLTPNLNEEFAFPSDNWTRVKGFVLLHKDTNSLIGNYSLYQHTRFKDAQRWQLESTVMCVEETKWVEGPQWIDWRDTEVERLQRAEVEQEAVLDLHLTQLGVVALGARVWIILAYGGIHRIELGEDTQFISAGHEAALTLPRRLNVLEGLSLDSKLAARAEAGL